LFREFVVAKRRRREQTEHALWVAWETANLSRADKLPQFKDLVKKRLLTKQEISEEQAAMWRHIGELYGRVRKHKKGRVRIIRG
jgi:hypothetical protein